MKQAEALCDRIAIQALGQRAVGSLRIFCGTEMGYEWNTKASLLQTTGQSISVSQGLKYLLLSLLPLHSIISIEFHYFMFIYTVVVLRVVLQ